jgi:hypothetical protein
MKYTCQFCLAVILSAALPVAVQGQFNYSTNAGGANVTITGYTGDGGPVVIPEAIDHLPVVNIEKYAFARRTSITSVVIPDTVTNIGEGAFTYMDTHSRLTELKIGRRVVGIGRGAFSACDQLERIIIPESVTSIGAGAFVFCNKLPWIEIPAGVTNIEDGAFNACSKLWSIKVDPRNPAYCSIDGVLYDKKRTRFLQFPSGKTGAYVIPQGVTNIAHFALWNCSSLTSITLPEGIPVIGSEEFAACHSLETVYVPASVTNIGPNAFNSCGSMWAIYFYGNSPDYGEPWRGGRAKVLGGLDSGTVCYLAGTTGWGTNFGGRPTEVWEPETLPEVRGLDENLTKQMSKALRECQKIKPGMTRAELEKVFTTEGGIWQAKHRIYVYRPCRYIKVEVDFNLSVPEQDVVKPLPTDTISKISRPYLQWTIID